MGLLVPNDMRSEILNDGDLNDVAVVFTLHWRFSDHACPAVLVKVRHFDDDGRCFADFLTTAKFYVNISGKSHLDGEDGFVSTIMKHFAGNAQNNRLPLHMVLETLAAPSSSGVWRNQ